MQPGQHSRVLKSKSPSKLFETRGHGLLRLHAPPPFALFGFYLEVRGVAERILRWITDKKHHKHTIQSTAVGHHCLGGTKIVLGCAKSEQI